MRKKVLIITPFYNGIGGAETYCQALVKEAREKYDVYIITLDNPPKNWQGTEWRRVYRMESELWQKARSACENTDYDVIHAQGLIAAYVGMILKTKYGGKLLITILALYDFKGKPFWFRWLCRWILNHADKIFVEGETGRQDLLDCGVKEKKLIKFMHWVDLDKFKPSGKKHKDITVLFVGRPIPIKGRHIIEEIEKRLFYLKDLRFIYVENVPYKDLPKYYQMADICIVPSIYSEGISRVVLEAAASGCVLIVSNKGALPEIVRWWGYCTNPWGDAIVDMLMKIYNNRTRMERTKHNTRLYAERYFTSKNAETILKEYE